MPKISRNRARILALLLDEMPPNISISKTFSARYPVMDDDFPPFAKWEDTDPLAWEGLDLDFDTELSPKLFSSKDLNEIVWEVEYAEEGEEGSLIAEGTDLVRALLLARNRIRLAFKRRVA
jgi:hypothetical protein